MSFRSVLVSLAAKAKKTRLLDVPVRYNPIARAAVFRAIRRGETPDIEARRALSQDLTARIVAAARRSEYGNQFGPDIAAWPVLPKSLIRADPQRFRTRQLFTIPASTGGTTGVPLQLVRSPGSVAAEQAFYDHMIRRSGLTWRKARVASLRGDNIKSMGDSAPPYAVETLSGKRLLLSTPHLNAGTVPWYFERLRDFKPDILAIYPTTGALLLKLLDQAGLDLAIPRILCSSERLPASAMAALSAKFQAEVFDYYGQAERVVLSVATAPNQHYFYPAYGKVELLPPTTDEDPGSGLRALSIVSTGFWNTAMPLIRYDTGDHALVPADASDADIEAITLGFKPFYGVAGRGADFLYAPGGGRLTSLDQIPREVDHILQMQIIQEALDRVTFQIMVEKDFAPWDRAKLEAHAKLKIPAAMQFRFEIVDRLESLPNGKTPFIIRRITAP
jgi:phenylacetate-CoA ligase